ncbi:hypothetical protein [Blastococcus brunescens]|uniref:Uncharacterized protein n=1 Tax=Blastococcus brunescens TaxID=1564165 RepID=A0ABZ1B7N7_9ACTN|nr:hypothetical protein [Blastococcus sp. BMG 8361]WRL65050.1 hypothetical protein U6N30_04930 [Blastococcus sp. BMG 8361]
MLDPITLPEREDADAKAWFYLDHRQDIEIWAALRDDAAQLLNRYLVDLAPTFEKLAVEIDAEPEFSDELESGQWPTLGLRRATWHHHGVADLSVVLEWERPRLLKPGRNTWPFVAVRLPRSQEDPQRRRQVTEAVAPVHAQLKGGRKEIVWPYYRYVLPPTGAPALDPAAYLTGLVASFRELWDVAAPALDALHR